MGKKIPLQHSFRVLSSRNYLSLLNLERSKIFSKFSKRESLRYLSEHVNIVNKSLVGNLLLYKTKQLAYYFFNPGRIINVNIHQFDDFNFESGACFEEILLSVCLFFELTIRLTWGHV